MSVGLPRRREIIARGRWRFTDSLRSLAPEGRLLVIGFTGGEIPRSR
jgi:hypothetical protein